MRKPRVVLAPVVQDAVRRLAPVPKRNVREVLDALQRDPELGKPLEGDLVGLRRVRVGELRLIYVVTANTVEVVAIGPRKTIYTELERAVRMPGVRSRRPNAAGATARPPKC